jgi:hypothetical protein
MATTTKTIKEVSIATAFRGLCSTCNDADTCVMRKAAGDVMYCDMFDDRAPIGEHAVRLAPALEMPHNGNGAAKGLCGNCESHGDCAHESPSGKWYCEQYQ